VRDSHPRVLLLVPDGVGLRTFLCSRFPSRLRERGASLDVWHALPDEVLDEHRAALGPDVAFHRLPVRREPVRSRVLRTGKRFAPLYAHREAGTEKLLVDRSHTAVDHVVHRSGQVLGRALAQVPAALPAVERAHARVSRGGPGDPWSDQLRVLDPDVVLCTHQRAGIAVPAVAAARDLGIPTATFVHSWDNLPKGRMAVAADHVLVWSDKMAMDLRRYQPDVVAAAVHVVGTPQLEAHVDPQLAEPRAPFLRSLGLDPNRPVVVWSGGDRTTSPRDPAYLADLADAVAQLSPRPQLAFRRSPADHSGRYDEVLARHPEVVVADPVWTAPADGGWDRAVPSRVDVAVLANLARHADLVVNLGSTVAMDFAAHGTPALYVRYDPGGVDARDWDVHDIYRLPHFASVHATEPIGWVDRRDDLAGAVAHALAHPDEHAEGREAWLELEVAQPLDLASQRCVQVLLDVARPQPRAGLVA
jgi:hypothetical protein